MPGPPGGAGASGAPAPPAPGSVTNTSAAQIAQVGGRPRSTRGVKVPTSPSPALRRPGGVPRFTRSQQPTAPGSNRFRFKPSNEKILGRKKPAISGPTIPGPMGPVKSS
jgi:hypothetical protein